MFVDCSKCYSELQFEKFELILSLDLIPECPIVGLHGVKYTVTKINKFQFMSICNSNPFVHLCICVNAIFLNYLCPLHI